MNHTEFQPFLLERTISSKTVCNRCMQNIPLGELRIARMTNSPSRVEGNFPRWYHFLCLFPTSEPNENYNIFKTADRPLLPSRTDQIEGIEMLYAPAASEQYSWLVGKIAQTKKSQINGSFMPEINWAIVPVPKKFRYSERSTKLTMKDSVALDPNAITVNDQQLKNNAHIYKGGGKTYTETLCLVNLDAGCNDYYKVQIYESDSLPYKYWLFRSWGRIGEPLTAKHVCDEMDSKESAITTFNSTVQEKVGALPNANYTPIEIDYGKVKVLTLEHFIRLEPQLDKFVRKVFNEPPEYEHGSFEFELDTETMPLGRISDSQLLKAYTILDKLTNLLIVHEGAPNKGHGPLSFEIVSLINQYLTLVPRKFPQTEPPLWNTVKTVQAEVEELENLMELELNLECCLTTPKTDALYKSLRCDIVVLDRNSEIWTVLEKYLNNTHLPTTQYKLVLENIYTVARHGEYELFQKSKDATNRKLLWHGTPTHNIKSILVNGLGLSNSFERYTPSVRAFTGLPGSVATAISSRTAVFFADMASKSIQYIRPTAENNTGALLLSEVALGTLAGNGRSYVGHAGASHNFIRGSIYPNPNEVHILPNNVVVPFGQPVGSGMFNEYVVYDKAQVNVQFLLEITFDFANK